MGTLTDAKTVYGSSATAGGFSNQEIWVSVDYNFTNDGGQIEDNTVLTAGESFLILDFYATVGTTVVGAGANIDLGVNAGGTHLWNQIDGPSLIETDKKNIFAPSAAFSTLVVPEDATIQLGVSNAVLTAGVFTMNFKIKKV